MSYKTGKDRRYPGISGRTSVCRDSFCVDFQWKPRICLVIPEPNLRKKHLDMVAANNLKVAGAGFQGDTNVLTLITQDEDVSLQLMSKEDAANSHPG